MVLLLAWTPLDAIGHDDASAHREPRVRAAARLDALTRVLMRAEFARDDGRLNDAREAIATAGRLGPDDPRVTRLAAALAFAEGDVGAAESLATAVLAQTPADPHMLRVRGRCRAARQSVTALDDLDAALELAPNPDEDAWLERAQVAAALAGPPAALAGLDVAARAHPWTPARLTLAVELEVTRGDLDAAFARIARDAPTFESGALVLARRARLHARLGNFGEACASFTEAVAQLDAETTPRRAARALRAALAGEARTHCDALPAVWAASKGTP